MDLRIKSVNFDATEQLKLFVEKKIEKLEKLSDEIKTIEVTFKLIKPESNQNKEASIAVFLKHKEAFASKQGDSFEECLNQSIEALERQILKDKDKKRG